MFSCLGRTFLIAASSPQAILSRLFAVAFFQFETMLLAITYIPTDAAIPLLASTIPPITVRFKDRKTSVHRSVAEGKMIPLQCNSPEVCVEFVVL